MDGPVTPEINNKVAPVEITGADILNELKEKTGRDVEKPTEVAETIRKNTPERPPVERSGDDALKEYGEATGRTNLDEPTEVAETIRKNTPERPPVAKTNWVKSLIGRFRK